jgi:glutathione S-transferase
MTLHIYGRHTSYNVQKVLWLADELELTYLHTQIGGKHGGNDSNEFLELNPMGKVPVVLDGDHSVWESNTILRYLTNKFGESQWQVNNSCERSQYECWMDWSQTVFEPAFIGVFWGYYRTPPHLRDNKAILNSVEQCETCLDILSNQLTTKSYFLGTNLSLADISTGVFLHRLYQIDLKINFPENIHAWYKRLAARPAYFKWSMSDFSELEARLDY